MHNVTCCLKVCLLTQWADIYNFPEVLEASRILGSVTLIFFPSFMDHKRQNPRFLSSNAVCLQYWLSEQICLEL